MAVKESTSPLFVKACDEFIYLQAKGKQQRRSKEPHNKPQAVVPEIAKEMVEAILDRATGQVNPSAIKEAIVRKEPDFDERDHGFSSFTRLLEAMEKEGLLKIQSTPKGQRYVVPV